MKKKIIDKEKLDIRPSKQPQKGYPLSGVVWYVDAEGKGCCYIKFAEPVVDALARVLPYGLGEATPGYLKVIQKPSSYEIWFCYIDVNKSLLLWTDRAKPFWCNKVIR